MKIRRWIRICAVICLSLPSCAPIFGQAGRTLTTDDLFKIEVLADAAVSPDGKMVAVVRRRSVASDIELKRANFFHYYRDDVWLIPVNGGAPVNITQGGSDGSGFWRPAWSPDGARLAMLSTRGGVSKRLWVFDISTRKLTRLSDNGVSFFAWIDSYRLAVVLLPEGGEQTRSMIIQNEAAMDATEQWKKAFAAQGSTASIVESGAVVDSDTSRQQVAILSVRAPSRSVGDTTGAWKVWPSPDGRYMSFPKKIANVAPEPEKLMTQSIYREGYQLVISDTVTRQVAGRYDVKSIMPNSFCWSRKGYRFAFIGAREREGPYRVYQGAVDGSINEIALPTLNPQSINWTDKDSLLVSATKNDRIDWWLVSPNKVPRNLTEQLKAVPAHLLPDLTGTTFIGVADGDVWRLNLTDEAWTNLTTSFAPKITAVAWPDDSASRDDDISRIILSVNQGSVTEYYRMDVSTGNITPISRPSPSAELVSYHPAADVAVFSAAERIGTYLTIVQGQELRPLLELNTFLRDIAQGQLRQINYRSLDGDDLKAWLVMPSNYRAGKRYPLVTWVYAGWIAKDTPPSGANLTNDTVWNLQLLAARGYLVVMPSMPLKPAPSDPYMELAKGVLPAVDKVIEMGIVDPQRLSVMGHSYGGYSTMGLVEQTRRFKAAIAVSGVSDLVSLFGGLGGVGRYFPDAYPDLFAMTATNVESGQLRMGNPPWKDWGRYWRNSPLFNVERVQTPLLIVHGDIDTSVGISQSEEFFGALYRQGKRARFVRYWGEGHAIISPANTRDYWTQVYSWLDQFCDISRDASGNLVFDGDHVKSRNGSPPLESRDFDHFEEVILKDGQLRSKTLQTSH